MLKNIMRKKMLIMILWGFPLCFCGGAEFPEFTVEDYGSALVGSAECPRPVEPPTTNFLSSRYWQWYNSEGGQDWVRIHGSPWGIIAPPDENWPSYVDPSYWGEFLSEYQEYYNYVYNYFDGNIPYSPEPEPEDPIVVPEDPAMPLSDDIGAIIGMILMGIAYGILAYRVRRE